MDRVVGCDSCFFCGIPMNVFVFNDLPVCEDCKRK